ncbi:RNA helicase, partial [Aeromonas sp. HMWF014]
RQGAGRSANGGNAGGARTGNGGKPKPQGGQRPADGAGKPAQARRPRRSTHNQ